MTVPAQVLRGWGRVVVFGAAAVWLASLWNPFYIEPPTPQAPNVERDPVAEFAVGPDDVGPVLTDGVRVGQDVLVGVLSQPRWEAVALEACVALSFVTYARVNAGEVVVTLQGGGRSESFVVPAAEIEDWGTEVFCLALGDGAGFDGRLTVVVEGRGASTPDEAVSLLIGGRSNVQRGGFAAAATVVDPGGAAAAAAGALGLRVSVDRLTVSDGPPRPPLLDHLLLWVLPLGLPMVVAILVIVLLGLDVTARLAEDPVGGQEPQSGEEVIDSGPAGVSWAVGGSLLLAGALILTVGLRPSLDDRDLVRLEPTGRGVAPASGVLLSGGEAVEQILPVSEMPEADEVGRDALGRRERLCLAVPGFVRDGRAEEGQLSGSIEMVVAPGPAGLSGARENSELEMVSEPVLLSAIGDERLVGCFAVTPEELRSAGQVRLTLRADGVPDGVAVEVGTRALRDGDSPVRGVGPEGTPVTLRALDVTWLRETPSYREHLFAWIGHGTLAAGVVLLGSTTIAGRLRRRRDGLLPVAGVR